MQTPSRLSLLTLAALAAGASAGCGGSQAAQRDGSAQKSATTVDEALLQVDQYEQELVALYGPLRPTGAATTGDRMMGDAAPSPSPGQAPGPDDGGTPEGAPMPPPAPESVAQATDDERDAEEEEPQDELAYGSGGRRCHIACRALSSMRRATERLCGLAGEQDHRCVVARTRVSVASARVEADCEECTE